MASIGMLVGIGQHRLAFIATLLAFLVLFSVGRLERFYFSKHKRNLNRLRIQIRCQTATYQATQKWIEDHYPHHILESRFKTDDPHDHVEMDYIILMSETDTLAVHEASQQVCLLPGVTTASVRTYFENEDNG